MPAGTALWVLAHPKRDSLNGHLSRVGTQALRDQGWDVLESDLYAMGWDPVHVETGGADVRAEQDKLRAADLVVLQFPLWWYGTPAILKGWIDRVFESGFAFDVPDPESGKPMKYGRGGLQGKRGLVVTTAGDRAASLGPRGISGHVDDVLWPLLHGTIWYTGMLPLRPHLVTDADAVPPPRLAELETELEARLRAVCDEEPLAYRPLDEQHYDHSIALHPHVAAGVEGNAAHVIDDRRGRLGA